jgi:hypothetical protein
MPMTGVPTVAHRAAGHAGFEINVVRRGRVNGAVICKSPSTAATRRVSAMTDSQWHAFLVEYSLELLADHRLLQRANVDNAAREAKWFGFKPASEVQISAAEDRLQRDLPPSLRSFYRALPMAGYLRATQSLTFSRSNELTGCRAANLSFSTC